MKTNDVKPIVLATILKYADEDYCSGLYHDFTGGELPDGQAGDEVFELVREAFLANDEKLLSYLGLLTDDAWNVMLAAIRDGDQTFRYGEGDFTSRKRYESCARSLSSCPYAMLITDDYGNTFFKLADEIRQKWRAELDAVISARTSWDRTYRMAEACVNLYGLISVEDFLSLLARFGIKKPKSDRGESPDDFDSVGFVLEHRSEYEDGDVWFEDDELMHECISDDAARLSRLREIAKDGKRWLPESADEFLRYADPAARVSGEGADLMRDCIGQGLFVEKNASHKDFLYVLSLSLVRGDDLLGDFLHAIGQVPVATPESRTAAQMDLAIRTFVRGLRLWAECGWTLKELGKPAELYVPLERKTAAVPRNAPCPCGSGKKYKMCCGKVQ